MFNENRVDWMYTFIYIFQKLCALIIPNCIPSLKMHIECTHSFMFNKKRVDWMYTFIYIFQKLCVLTIRNYIPSLKNVYIQSTRLWAFNYKSFFYFFFRNENYTSWMYTTVYISWKKMCFLKIIKSNVVNFSSCILGYVCFGSK